MLSLTRRTDYALVALAWLGSRRAAGDPPVSARRIAEEFDLPLALLMNILKDLARAKVVASNRGSQGGYSLAVDPGELSLLDIVTAIEGPARLAVCAEEDNDAGEKCGLACRCPIRLPIQRLNLRINRFLEEVTLADLMEGGIDVTLESVKSGLAGAAS